MQEHEQNSEQQLKKQRKDYEKQLFNKFIEMQEQEPCCVCLRIVEADTQKWP